MSDAIICIPGQKICKEDESHKAGEGTYVRQGFIYSSLAGYIDISKETDHSIVQVKRGYEQGVVPTPATVVTVKITNVNQRFCKCAIICVQDTVLKEHFRGIIRKEDVRLTEKDKIEMYKCFRPGDIVLARVNSLGDAHSYVLSTAENELGVVIAHSEAGEAMIPVSWTEMQCPKTLNKEFRKVAKVVPENFTTDPANLAMVEGE